jgi:predicted ABC-type transport system involved in lysophospholipase L1 biosynthesis ATPase subunit
MTNPDSTASDLDAVLQAVEDVFDKRIALVTEAVLSTKATLLLNGIDSCEGIAVVGPSGAGKTTALDFLKGAEFNDEELSCRTEVRYHQLDTEAETGVQSASPRTPVAKCSVRQYRLLERPPHPRRVRRS